MLATVPGWSQHDSPPARMLAAMSSPAPRASFPLERLREENVRLREALEAAGAGYIGRTAIPLFIALRPS